VLEVVAARRRQFTSFCGVTTLAVCGILFISGLVSISYLPTWLFIISITLVIWRVYRDTHTLPPSDLTLYCLGRLEGTKQHDF